MKYLLVYYTGTYNTRYLTELIKNKILSLNHQVDMYEINPLKTELLDFSRYDIIGLGYPIYGFNTPLPFVRFIKKQKFIKDQKVFIYKNSGETYHANDASSMPLVKKVKHDKGLLTNEYHFIFPYNIHFRFDENLVKEMLDIDNMLVDILAYELEHNINNLKRYRLIDRLVTFIVKLQYIGGPINSYFYKIDNDKCINCKQCIKLCPVNNIYISKKGKIKFHHKWIMCMRCSLFCKTNAIKIGLFDSWRVNGPYDFNRIKNLSNKTPIITNDTKGFFKCYVETYSNIRRRYNELFGENKIKND